ncbi:MAG: MFS transporter [Alphaproteobacteria bacterium]|nr:MAG: MFS transporter [Alphaproteobacteria bacterium]
MSRTGRASLASGVYGLITGDEDARLCRDIPEEACSEQPGNFLLQAAALTLSKIGDELANPKVVLPWLLGAIGAPAYLTGLLVPVRESLSLLPQLAVGATIRHFAIRKWFWSGASAVEGLCILAIAGVALAGLGGVVGGWLVIALLAGFSLARGVASVASKDTLGKTVSKTRRGRLNGLAEAMSGIVAGAVGLFFLLMPESGRSELLLFGMVVAAGVAWLLGAAVFARVREVPGATEGGRSLAAVLRGQLGLLLADATLRRFLLARTLLLGTALVGPVYVSLAQSRIEGSIAGLGGLVVATGVATALSGLVWGRLADRSSRLAMAAAAALAGTLGLAVTGCLWAELALLDDIWFYMLIIFVVGVAHAGVRVGRKTQLVDMAGGDRRAEYVALSNTIIGVMLLGAGAVSAGLMAVSLTAAILVLSVLALAGAALSLSLPEVQV